MPCDDGPTARFASTRLSVQIANDIVPSIWFSIRRNAERIRVTMCTGRCRVAKREAVTPVMGVQFLPDFKIFPDRKKK